MSEQQRRSNDTPKLTAPGLVCAVIDAAVEHIATHSDNGRELKIELYEALAAHCRDLADVLRSDFESDVSS